MAEGGSYIDSDKFKCPVCLDLMRTPVTIPCGHSYCMLCISRCWDKKDSSAGGPQACPQCRHKFTPRPKLAKNALLAELVEKLREERRVAGCSQTEPGGAGAAGTANPVKSTLSESCSIRDSLIKGVKQWQTELEKLIKAEESKAVSAAQSVLKNLLNYSTFPPPLFFPFPSDACTLTFDVNTVNGYLELNHKERTVMSVRESEIYFFHTKRFEKRQQALCKEGLRGSPRYWEVNCGNGGTWVSIGVSYKGIRRSGKHAPLFGRCKNSWALRKYGFSYYFWHDNKETSIKSSSLSPKIGVYLDHNAGVLAFYTVSKYTSLLYKVQTTFTEPVYAGFGLSGIGSQIQLCDLDSED
uniref:Uncharacterized protein n=1 Tax=Astyanax mexicanus TaxID=7994 RepID=W5LPN8_ASTMX